jgi:DNA-binding MarR family transcriptional regulator
MTQPTARLLVRVLQGFETELQARLHADGFTDVTVAQTNVLRHLNPDGMNQSALARDANLSKQAISQAIRALRARDLVAVEPDPSDQRAKRVVYTDRGRALIQCAVVHVLALEQDWQGRLGQDAYHAFRNALAALQPPDTP